MNLRSLLEWSKADHSQLPWRQQRTLYRTLVSEIMLQQTTVGTVKNHFERFLARFPDLKSLALASEEELLVAWKGLGYYRRAKNLKRIAEALYRDHDGEFPQELEALQRIPGIGPYTASALLAIGMDQPALAVDANLERVIARLLALKEIKGPKLQKKIRQLFDRREIFAKVKSHRALNEALMDLGRTLCQARKASCGLCPLRSDCAAFATKKPLGFPVEGKPKTKSVEHELHLLRLVVMKGKKLLVYKKGEGEWLSGQYEVPTLILNTTDKKISQYPLAPRKEWQPLLTFKTGITKYTIMNHVVQMSGAELNRLGLELEIEWRDWTREDANLSVATLKLLKKLKDRNERKD